MRELSITLQKKLASHVQAGSTGIKADLWVTRPNLPLTEEIFLEKQYLSQTSGVSRAAIAVSHPRVSGDATELYVGYVEEGTAKIAKAVYDPRISNTAWFNEDFSEPAVDVSVCFDGTMPKNTKGTVEFVTEGNPWIFWVSEGTLYAQQLGSTKRTVLAESNCIAVSAIRAVWSEVSHFNYGLVVFFIVGGYLYYRQLIDGKWYDAEVVNFGPTGVLWFDVSAFRTWDYKIGVQLISQNGTIYELYTQYMGVGTRSTEHIEMKDANSGGTLTGIQYHTFKNAGEHLTITEAYDAALYGGCYEPGDIVAVRAWNADDGTGDWGKHLKVEFTREINLHQVHDQESCFTVTDSIGTLFYPTTITADYTGRILIFDFMSFNNAVGDITVTYTPGTVASMCDMLLPGFSFTITPQNLVPVEGLPEAVRAWNSDGEDATLEDGRYVNIQFDQPLYGELSDNFDKFVVLTEQYVYSEHPDGTPVPVVVPFTDMYWHPTEENTIQFKFGSGNANSLQKCAGRIIVEYRGGTLYGEKGPLLSFSEPFVPEGIAYRGDAADGEHFTIASAVTTQSLVKINFSSHESPGEHVMMVDGTCSGTLTHIDNI